MGRYDRNKSKKSGRYRDGAVTARQPVRASDKSINIWVVLVLILIAAAGGFFSARMGVGSVDIDSLLISFFAKRSTPPQSGGSDSVALPQPQVSAESAPGADNLQQLQQAEESVILPELDSSDEQIREAITAVTPELAPWLVMDQLIRKYMVIANDFSQGLRVMKHLGFLKLEQSFSVEENGAEMFMSTESYQRYNGLAQAINAIDVSAMISVYQKFRPLLLQVFAEFSYPDGHNLDDVFIKAANEILTAPAIDQPIALVRPSLYYQFADPELEALNSVHKQMLRMGPANTRLIQDKVRMLVGELVNSKGY